MKKVRILFISVLCIFMLNINTYASVIQTVNSNSDNSIINNDIKFTKKIVNYNTETKEIEIELSIKNMNKNKKDKEDIEIITVLDDSGSMATVENNETRKTTTYIAATKFVDLIYDNISKLKLGVMKFSKKVELIASLTSSKQEALNGVDSYYSSTFGGDTCTHDALNSAKAQFSANCKNKVIILVTDGFPNSPNETKSALMNLSKNGIFVLSLIVGQEDNSDIQNVFGTEENPTAGKVYYINKNSEIDNIFNKFMYQEIINYMEHPISNIRIEDVFPKTILDYFDIEYENIKNGSITDIGDENSFTWTIDKLTGEETATFKYKIKVKDNVNITEILDTELKTNEKVIVKYDDKDGEEHKKILDENPSIVVKKDKNDDGKDDITNISGGSNDKSDEEKEFVIVDFTPEEIKNPNSIKKPTTKPSAYTERLPQTGLPSTTAIFILIGISTIVMLFFGIKLKMSNKK